MANTFAVSRNRLILGLCLPLAILLGYLLAEPLESTTLAIIASVIGVMTVPLVLRWYHPFLVFSWSATITLGFLPGRPYLWIVLSFFSFLVAIVTRAVHSERKFLWSPPVTWSLLSLLLVVVVTAALTGGIGLNALGSERIGGKGYFHIMAAVAGFFALTSQAIPLARARLYTALFLLSGLTAIVSNVIYYTPGLYFLYQWFPAEMAVDQWLAEYSLGDFGARISGVTLGAFAVNAFLLARYGVVGVFSLASPWRLALFLTAGFASMYGGFRSAILFQAAVFALLFMIEGLWRTRYLIIVLAAGLLAGVGLVLFVDRMPLAVQRAVSFLPLKLDPWVEVSAQSSTEWRLEIWRMMLPQVPKYLLKGKGYTLDPQELTMMSDFSHRGGADSVAAAAYSGDYHNGPLSVLIPFGIFGMATFLWFLAVGGWVLRQNYRYGDPALRTINAFLLALYLTRVLFFFFIFGALYSDLFNFTSLLGFSMALNGGVRRPEPQSESGPT